MAESDALLPTGMIDRLPDEAEREAEACERTKKIFASFGYRLVNPPMLEFEETMLAEGAGRALSTNTFRLMDPVSQRMMALRSDTTAQLARIAASSLKNAMRPLRLSYMADVLRINPTQLRPERQFKQAGCELIGAHKNAPTEIALMALLALHENGVKGISIDFTAPEILKSLSARVKDKDAVFKAVHRRDRAAFKSFGATGKILSLLDDLSGPAENFIKTRKQVKLPQDISAILGQLEKVIKELSGALKIYGLEKQISITVDPLEMRGFEYQSFPSFTLFASDVRGELGRGGSYLSQFGDHYEQACGFTLYMDSVLRALPKKGKQKAVLLSENASWKDLKECQDRNITIMRCAGIADQKKAKSIGASHIWKNGKTESIK